MDDFDQPKQGNKSHHTSKNKLKKKTSKSKFSFKDKKDKDENENENELDKRKDKRERDQDDVNGLKARQRNPRAFALQSFVAAERSFRRYFLFSLTLSRLYIFGFNLKKNFRLNSEPKT